MKHALLICGAGASSQFIVQRVLTSARRHAAANPSFTFGWNLAASALDVPIATTPDLVLLGPHLAAQLERARAMFHPTTVDILSADEYADHTGDLVVARLRGFA